MLWRSINSVLFTELILCIFNSVLLLKCMCKCNKRIHRIHFPETVGWAVLEAVQLSDLLSQAEPYLPCTPTQTKRPASLDSSEINPIKKRLNLGEGEDNTSETDLNDKEEEFLTSGPVPPNIDQDAVASTSSISPLSIIGQEELAVISSKPGSSKIGQEELASTPSKPYSSESQEEAQQADSLPLPPLLEKVLRGNAPQFIQEYNLALASGKEQEELKDSLYKLLKRTEEGKFVLKAFNSKSIPVHDKVRDSLSSIVVSFALNCTNICQISPLQFKYFALAIVALFCDERQFTYYIPLISGNKDVKKAAPKGKLYAKYSTLKKNLKASGLLQKQQRLIAVTVEQPQVVHAKDWATDYTADETVKNDLKVVKESPTSYQSFLPKWILTCFARLQALHQRAGHGIEIDTYLNAYPALKKPYALDLIKKDFDTLYPGKSNLLHHTWPVIQEHVISYAEQRVKVEPNFKAFIQQELPQLEIVEQLDAEDKTLLSLRLLATLINPKNSKRNQKFSRKDILDDFILYIPSGNDKSIELQRRQDRLKAIGHVAQPVPVIVGVESTARQYTVEFNGFIFNAESAVDAVDSCFQVIMTLNASYSPISSLVWQFVQQHIYKIVTDFDLPVPSFEVMATAFKLPK